MRVPRWLPVVLGIVVAGAGPAWAAPPAPPSPAVVTNDAGLTLFADDEGDQLCLTLAEGVRRQNGCSSDELGQAVVLGQADAGSTGGNAPTLREASAVGAAVPAAAVRVEVRRAGVLLAGAATVGGGAYTGKRAARLRFVLVRLPAGTRGDGLRIRALDAAGVVVAVLAPDRGDLVTRRRVVLAGRSGRTRWSLTGSRVSTLTPSLADLGHETVKQCIGVRRSGAGDGGEEDADCVSPDPQDALLRLFGAAGGQQAVEDDCATSFRLLHGVAPAGLSAARVLLGDGRTLAARVARIPDDQRSAYALVVPADAAIRSVRLVRTDGAARVLHLAAAPQVVSCASGHPVDALFATAAFIDPSRSLLQIIDDAPPPIPSGPITEVPGTPGFRVADGPDGTLCVAVAGEALTPGGCGRPSPGVPGDTGAPDSYVRPRAFVQVVPAEVVTVRISAKGAPPRELATVAGDGYTGAYAGRVRFVSAAIAGFADLRRTELLDATGRVLHSETADTEADDLPAVTPTGTRRLAGRPGGPSLWQTTFRTTTPSERPVRCLALTDGAPPRAAERCSTTRFGPATALLAAPCTTHRLTIAVVAAPGSRVVVDLGGGRTRRLALHGGAGVLTLPATQSLRELRLRTSSGAVRIRAHAPGGAAQCGWVTQLDSPAVTTPRRTAATRGARSGPDIG